jgi:hypothetical protein
MQKDFRMKALSILPASLALMLLLTGCRGWSLSQCVSPRVTGRVLDSETLQPLMGAEVQRVAARPRQSGNAPPKGAQLMQDAPRIVLTSVDGSFTLDPIYSVAAFRVLSWSSVDVQFRRAGYLTLTTNLISSADSSDSGGEPYVKAGDILLHRKLSTFVPGVLPEGSSTTTSAP